MIQPDPILYHVMKNILMLLKRNIYLQARIEPYSAYTYYVKLGFQLVSQHNNVDFHCVAYNAECPVNSNKAPQMGYYTDDVNQRLLSLKQWIYNVYLHRNPGRPN
jgi:hypothetical protein